MALSKKPRKTEGYSGNRHSFREKQWYCALSDRVGHKNAPEYADHIINWKQNRPPDHILARWLHEYDDGVFVIDDNIRARCDNKVERFHKQEHMGAMRLAQAALKRAAKPLLETGDMAQPVILKYLLDGMNQGMMLHNTRTQQQEQLSVGGLTINIGQKPPQRKLRQKDVDQILDGEFKLLPEVAVGQSAS